MSYQRYSVFAVLVMLAVWPRQASAANAIYYSDRGNAYGWCAGYGHEYAHSCAGQYCRKNGGTNCSLVLDCDGGWGAIALAENPALGFGASCGFTTANAARIWALSRCCLLYTSDAADE